MREVGSFEAKTHLPQLIDEVLRGDRVVITRRGKKVAMLVPVDQETGANAKAAGERLRALREGVAWGGEDGVTIRDAVEDGRR